MSFIEFIDREGELRKARPGQGHRPHPVGVAALIYGPGIGCLKPPVYQTTATLAAIYGPHSEGEKLAV